MIEQLESVDIEDWPRVLIKHLKKIKSETKDMAFQSEVYQADIKYNSMQV